MGSPAAALGDCVVGSTPAGTVEMGGEQSGRFAGRRSRKRPSSLGDHAGPVMATIATADTALAILPLAVALGRKLAADASPKG